MNSKEQERDLSIHSLRQPRAFRLPEARILCGRAYEIRIPNRSSEDRKTRSTVGAPELAEQGGVCVHGWKEDIHLGISKTLKHVTIACVLFLMEDAITEDCNTGRRMGHNAAGGSPYLRNMTWRLKVCMLVAFGKNLEVKR